MNATIKAAWIAALRSGEYPQEKNALRTETGYCCLGVLCDLHAKAGLGKWESEYASLYVYIDDTQTLPTAVMQWAELGSLNPIVYDTTLAELNDGVEHYDEEEECDVIDIRSHNFSEIADLIEKYL